MRHPALSQKGRTRSQRILLLALFLLLVLSLIPQVRAEDERVWYVDDDADPGGDGSQWRPFRTIQEGVNEAGEGDRVFVYSGNYTEQVVVNKTLTLEGESREDVIIDAEGGVGVELETGYVRFSFFTVTNGSVGLSLLSGTENITIDASTIQDNDIGVRLRGTKSAAILGSLMIENRVGILVTEAASGCRVSTTTITGNRETGINATDNRNESLEASRCFWGDRTGPHDPEANPEGKGDNVTELVLFRPWYENEEMQKLRFVNETDDDESLPALYILVGLVVLTLLLLYLVVKLPDSYFDRAWKWFVTTFELDTMTEKDKFVIYMCLYFLGLIVMVFLADLAAVWLYDDHGQWFYPLRRLETIIIGEFQQNILGIEVSYKDTVLFYNEDQEFWGHTLTPREKVGGVALEISATCSGFHETVFLTVLILGFYGVDWRTKFKWAGIFAVVIFVENLIRITILFPYYLVYGRDEGELLHYNWWHSYQYVFIMSLFMLWFYFVAWKQLDEQLDEMEKGEKKKGDGDKGDDGKTPTEGSEGEKEEDKNKEPVVAPMIVTAELEAPEK